MSKGSAIAGFILCFLCGMGLMWGIDRSGGPKHTDHEVGKEAAFDGAAFDHTAASVPVSQADPSWGASTAPVTIVEFSNFQCGYCSKVTETLNALKQKYGPDKLRIVWKNSPAPRAIPTHAAAMTVYELGGAEAFWKFHDLAFQNVRSQTPESFATWAAQVGVDKAKFEAALKTSQAQQKLEQDKSLAAQLGVRGTPGFFINGVSISGAQPQQKFEEEIDKQLKAAEQLIASGTAKDQVYVTLTNRNKAKAPAPAEAAKRPQEKKEDTATVWKVTVSKDDPYKGNPNAQVTIVEFSEFQCPFCRRVLPTLKQIEDTYKDKVRIVWKSNPLPFHKRANPASQLAREALAQKGMEGFWKANELLFENQKQLEDDDLWRYAETLGLDVEKVKEAVTKQKHQAAIEASQELAQDLNASGTPHFFVNGRRLVGAKPFEEFKTIIDEEITKAETLLKKGIKPEALYEEIIRNGKEPPPPEKKDVGPPPKNAPWKGTKDAKLIIHEFSDFQCPFCARVNETIAEVMKSYGDRVKLVWRHKPLPFHKEAPLAHEVAQEAWAQKGNEGFWKMHDTLFANQKKQKPEDAPADWHAFSRDQLEQYAEAAGLDLAKLKKALDEHTHKTFIDGEAEVGDKAGIRGTPGFVIGEYFIAGAQPYSRFKKLIERSLKELKEGKKEAAPEAKPAAPTAP